MKTGAFALIGLILTIGYIVYFASTSAWTLLILPLAWIVAVWMIHGLSRAYIVTLVVGILLDLHYFNFGLITSLLLIALSASYFIYVSVISSANITSTFTIGAVFPLLYFFLLWLSSGLVNGYHYYPITLGLLLTVVFSALCLSLLTSSYCWLIRRIIK